MTSANVVDQRYQIERSPYRLVSRLILLVSSTGFLAFYSKG
jgi:hypothetical protein